MQLLVSFFSLVWMIIAFFLSGFVLWRTLRSERVDHEDEVVDKAAVSLLWGLIAGRVVYGFLHLDIFGSNIWNWIAFWQKPGMIGVAAIIFGLFIFWRLVKGGWKDATEILDYVSIALVFFLFIMSLGEALNYGLAYLISALSRTATIGFKSDARFILLSSFTAVFYLILYLFLTKVEKKYRTFLWYRAKRRSAQTGFVFASFLIGFGFFGFLTGWFAPSQTEYLRGIIEPVTKLLVMAAGFVILYFRSGRTFLSRQY